MKKQFFTWLANAIIITGVLIITTGLNTDKITRGVVTAIPIFILVLLAGSIINKVFKEK